MNKIKGQQGFSGALILAMTAIIALGGYMTYRQQNIAAESAQLNYELLAQEIQDISAASLKYFRESYPTNRFPVSMKELLDSGYYTGNRLSRAGAEFKFNTQTLADGTINLSISVNAPSERIAEAAKTLISNGNASGRTLTSTIRAPFQSELYADYLQRYYDARRPEMTVMNASINFAGGTDSNINRIDSLSADSADIINMITPQGQISKLVAQRAEFTNGSEIIYSSNNLTIKTPQLDIAGNLSTGGDVLMNGHSIQSVGEMSSQKLTAAVGEIQNVKGAEIDYIQGRIRVVTGDSINYVTGQITGITGYDIKFNQGEINYITGNELGFGSGQISSLAGSTINYGSGSVATITGSSLGYNSGTIGTASGQKLNYSNGQISGIAGKSLLFTSGTITTAAGAALNFSSGNINSASGSVVNFADITSIRLIGNTAQFSGVVVTSNSDFNSLSSGSYQAGTYTSNQVSASNLSVDTLRTGNIVANTSSLGAATSNALTVSGLAAFESLNTPLATVTNASITTLTGSAMSYSNVSANTFQGGNFEGSDFQTGAGASENQIRADLDKRKLELDNCMYITQYCINQTPKTSLTCSGCVGDSASTAFTATIRVQISDCRHGCNYTWALSGVNGSCPSGSVAAGGSASVTCTVTGSVASGQTQTGTVSLTARNNKTNLTDKKSTGHV